MIERRRMWMVGLGAVGSWLVLGLGTAAANAEDMAVTAAPTAMVRIEAPATAAPELTPGVVEGLKRLYARDYTGAVSRFSAAVEADPGDPAARYYLGYSYYRMGDFGQARTAFAEAYRIDPHYSPEPKAP